MKIMASGELTELHEVIHPDAVNREATAEPPDCRVQGPAAFAATARWLRSAFAELAFDIHETAASDDLVVVHCTMSGRQVGPFVTYDEHGRVAQAFPATGRQMAVTHTHWTRMRDGLVFEHWANRDDMSQALQLRWVPPTPLYLCRMALAKRQASRRQ
ncbi:ester cyclase [Actinoplanes friuliensis]|uniref:Putative SnoaL-like polyketide cyclase n=1 Tax=Actinoplanes friuliensis DSM 7358 TaxID=1246995 RepID=U5W431_9ACTN|nr:ester cyclase [Actinoplanes friuliensis]AGZ43973.1 putative SnoaL-like polyketide cyclase [Actinoplanes friuliensis DSM 7358]